MRNEDLADKLTRVIEARFDPPSPVIFTVCRAVVAALEADPTLAPPSVVAYHRAAADAEIKRLKSEIEALRVHLGASRD